jgi:hypothetical protein
MLPTGRLECCPPPPEGSPPLPQRSRLIVQSLCCNVLQVAHKIKQDELKPPGVSELLFLHIPCQLHLNFISNFSLKLQRCFPLPYMDVCWWLNFSWKQYQVNWMEDSWWNCWTSGTRTSKGGVSLLLFDFSEQWCLYKTIVMEYHLEMCPLIEKLQEKSAWCGGHLSGYGYALMLVTLCPYLCVMYCCDLWACELLRALHPGSHYHLII